MTTSKPTDTREFWVDPTEVSEFEDSDDITHKCGNCFSYKPDTQDFEVFHVIEHAAYEQLKAEIEKAYEELAGNICGYCWKKMEDEPTAKQTHQEYANQLVAEIAALKARLLDFEGRTYSENQQLEKLKDNARRDFEDFQKFRAQIKDYELALEFYGDKSKWFEKDNSICIDDDDTELSDYVKQLGADEYGGKRAREVLKKWRG